MFLVIIFLIFISFFYPSANDALILWDCLSSDDCISSTLKVTCLCELCPERSLIVLSLACIADTQSTLTRHDLITIEVDRTVPLSFLGKSVEVIDLLLRFIIVSTPDWVLIFVFHIIKGVGAG